MLIGLNVQLQAPSVLAEQSNPVSIPKGQSLQPRWARNCRVDARIEIAFFSHPIDPDCISKIVSAGGERSLLGFKITFHTLPRLKGVPCPIPAKDTGPFPWPPPDQHRSGCLGSEDEVKFGHRFGSGPTSNSHQAGNPQTKPASKPKFLRPSSPIRSPGIPTAPLANGTGPSQDTQSRLAFLTIHPQILASIPAPGSSNPPLIRFAAAPPSN